MPEIHEILIQSNYESLLQTETAYRNIQERAKQTTAQINESAKQQTTFINEQSKIRVQNNDAANKLEFQNFKVNQDKIKAEAKATANQLNAIHSQALKENAALSRVDSRLPTNTGFTGSTLMGSGSVMIGSPQALGMQAKYEAGLVSAREKTNALYTATGQFNQMLLGVMAIGITMFVKKLWEADLESEKFHVTLNKFSETNFNGDMSLATEQIELFRKATAGTVADKDLIQLSNQATDLGVSLKDQAVFFSLAKESQEKYGGSINESFTKVLTATENGTRGLKAVGIQVAVYQANLKRLVEEQKGSIEVTQSENGQREITIKNLDPEIQKRLKIQAVIMSSNITYDEAINRTQTEADSMEHANIMVENGISYWGKFVVVLFPFIRGLKDIARTTGEVIDALSSFDKCVKGLDELIPGAGSSLNYLAGVWHNLAQTISDANTASHDFSQQKMGNTDVLKNQLLNAPGSMTDNVQKWLDYTHSNVSVKDALKKLEISTSKDNTDFGAKVHTDSPTGSHTGNSPVEEKKEELNLLTLERQHLEELNKQYAANSENIGALNGIWKQILDSQEKISFLQDGINKAKSTHEQRVGSALNIPTGAQGIKDIVGSANDPTRALAKSVMDNSKMIDAALTSIKGAFVGLFSSIVPKHSTLSAFQQFMKQILTASIDAAQAEIFIASAVLSAKGITTFGLSMITDAPLLAAAWVALEVAKGFVGAFEMGGITPTSGFALVGEGGPEIVHLPGGSRIYNNHESVGIANQSSMKQADVYLTANMDGLTFMRTNSPKYGKFARFKGR